MPLPHPHRILACLALVSLAGAAVAAATPRRPLALDDLANLRDVYDPQLSPDGEWIAYTVDTADEDADGWSSDVWMTRWDGSRSVQLTATPASETDPRWSPDGRWLAFLSDRDGKSGAIQLWLLDRAGGEAERITNFAGDVSEYAWSPDGRRLALVVEDADPAAAAGEDETPPPIVIDRYYFKEDETGYLGKRRRHLYLLDVASRAAEVLTPGDFDEIRPSWSPDGKRIAFFSKRTGDWDRNNLFGLYLVEPRAGAAPRLVTTVQGDSGDTTWMNAPAWSPDGRQLAIVVGGDPKLIYYGVHALAVVPAAGGPVRELTRTLDRNVDQPHWSRDGRSLYFLLEDDGNQHVARVGVAGGEVTRLTPGRHEITALDVGARDRIAILQSTPARPPEVFALEGGRARPLSRQNDAWLAGVELAPVEEIRFQSRDGTPIAGFLVKPPGAVAGRRYPAILRVHGGPASQFANAFDFEWQLLAARGYAVVAANPRGSTGRGEAFATAIFADWGNKDSGDVIAAVDYAVAAGVADPDRLGVGGWSYGGILTNQVIARDTRFRAATSGASQSNALAGYGTDMYVREYEAELGLPWKDTGNWMRVSYPFLHADRIVTPTLFLCGSDDFNVPLLNSEQMYQALRSRGVPTELVIYPGETHGLSRLSYVRDRYERYLAWYGKYLATDERAGPR